MAIDSKEEVRAMAKIKRKIIRIDEDKCNGCGQCIPSCKEGALRIIDGKARLVSDAYCDGLGACLGECPQGALTIEEREAEEFDEVIVKKDEGHPLPCGCPGTMARSLKPNAIERDAVGSASPRAISELGQWPVQLALVPVNAPYLKGADFVLLADCTAVAYANLHRDFLRGRAVAIACPKLDDVEPYVDKLSEMMRINDFRSIEVVMMEVPCCGGLFNVVSEAARKAGSDLRIQRTTISLDGKILNA